jgi:hypothetical protein
MRLGLRFHVEGFYVHSRKIQTPGFERAKHRMAEAAILTISYLPRLRNSDIHVAEIPSAAHFLFYDNPVATYEAIGAFVHAA